MHIIGAEALRFARLASTTACVVALGAVALPARADDPAYGLNTQLYVEAGAGTVDTQSQNSGLVQAGAPITYSFTAAAAGGGASATATATATSFYGYLDLSASGAANPSPLGNGAGSSFSAVVGNFPVDYFRDQIFVQPSGALPVGSLVPIGFTIDYSAGALSAVSEPGGLQPSRAGLSTEFQLTDLDTAVTIFDITHGTEAGLDSFTVMVPVGQRIRLEGSLFAFGTAASGSGFAPTSFSVIDPTTINFEAITPGLDLVTASGHDYSQAGGAPEPAAWALMLLGFGAAGAALRSRRQTVSS